MTIRMQKGNFVTHVYNNPEIIADAEKKGFRLIGIAKPTLEADVVVNPLLPETGVGVNVVEIHDIEPLQSAEAETEAPKGKGKR